MVGRLCAMISVIIPGYLIVVMAGGKRALEVLPAILACGLSFAGMQFYVSNYMGPELTDILSSLTCIIVMVLVLKLWKPKTIMRLEGDKPVTAAAHKHTPSRDVHGVGAVPAAGGLRAGLGRGRDQADDQSVGRQPAARRLADRRRHRPARRAPDGAGTAQSDYAHPARGARAGAVCRAVRAELAERVGHGVLVRDPRDGDRAARAARQGRAASTSIRSSS